MIPDEENVADEAGLRSLVLKLRTRVTEVEGTAADLNSLLSSISVAVVAVDRDLVLRRITPSVNNLLDLIPSNVGGQLSELLAAWNDAALLADVGRVFETGEPSECEVTNPSGRVYLRRAVPHRSWRDGVDEVIITFFDITHHKQVEYRLQASEKRHRIILDAIKEYAIFMTDLHGKIETWTPAAERISGYPAAEAINQSIGIIFTPEDLAIGAVELELKRASERGSVTEERWHVRRDGSRFWGAGMLYAIESNGGNLSGYVKILRDRTKQKELDEMMHEARIAAESANEAKDHFLANVSHELRTPLSAMLLWTKILTDQKNQDGAQLLEGLDAIRKCAEEQQAIIEDLVDISKISAGKLRLESVPCDLTLCVKSTVDSLRPIAAKRNLRLAEHYGPEVGIVRADPHRLHQIVWNLLTNAGKFTPSGGEISVRTIREGDDVLIEIHDTGQGIGAELMPRIFDRFSQGENLTTRHERGLGLGLSITKQLVDLHDGSITAYSAGAGAGSTFTVRLPLPELAAGDVETAENVSPPSSEVDLSGLRILLVEDAADTRRALVALLEEAKAQVTSTQSAVEAMESFKAQRPHVVLSDIGLPGEDGFSLLKQIREWESFHNLSEIPALALTAYADDRNRRKVLESGFGKFLTKPVNPTRLLTALAKFKPAG